MEENPRVDAGEQASDAAIWRPDEGSALPPSRREETTRLGRPPERRRSRRRRRVLRPALSLGILTVAVVLLVDMAYAGFGLASGLQEARTSLQEARESLREGDLTAARQDLEGALAASSDAAGYARHPGLWIVSGLPDVRVAAALARAAELASGAGIEAVAAARVLGVEDGDFATSLYDGGVLRLAAIREAEPVFEKVDRLLDDSAAELDDVPPPLVNAVEDALLDARREVATAAEAAHKASVLFGALPALLGEGSPRSYLLAFQALGEARATGGLIGYYGELRADSGRLRLVRSAPIGDVPRYFPAVDAPGWFAESYGPQSALNQVQQVNVSPNFPVVGEVVLRMFEGTRGASFDGVVAMDPVALSHLMRATGPIEVPGSGITATANNVTKLLLHDSYVDFETEEQQNLFLGRLIDAFWAQIKKGEFDGPEFARGVADAVESQHLKVYSRDEAEQEALAEVEADGSYANSGPNVQMVFNNNYSVNKVDYFLHRKIDTYVELTSNGTAAVQTTVKLRNEAPEGPPSLLLGPDGPDDKDEPGMNRMILNVLLPEGAEEVTYRSGTTEKDPFFYEDRAHTIVWDYLDLEPAEREKVTVRYEVPGAVDSTSRGLRFTLTLFPQATVNPDRYSFAIEPPEGFVIQPVPASASTSSLSYSSSGILDVPTTFTFDLVPS